MKYSNATRFTFSMLGLAIAGIVTAQQPPTDFPATRTKPATCEDFRWNAEMTREHPRVIEACQETVDAEGSTWARLEARFVRVQSDGQVVFSIRDKNARVIEEVTVQPSPGQVAYIDDRATEFKDLSATDRINLYVVEGQYGWSTRPGVTTQRFTRVATTTTASTENDAEAYDEVEAPPERYVASSDPQRMNSRLPDTAGVLPWAALTGTLFLIGGLTLSLRRKL